MKIVPPAVSCAAAELNRLLWTAVDAPHALRTVLLDPDGFAVFELNCLNRANSRAESASVAALVHRKAAGCAGKFVEHWPHERGLDDCA